MSHLMNTYARHPVAFVRGEGVWLWDEAGKKYLDALAGIAVNTLGYGHPKFSKALLDRINSGVIHTSNLWRIPDQEAAADRIAEITGLDEVFFCNSGLEATEASIKVARKYGHDKGIAEPAIVVLEMAFHGRSLATLSATGSRKVQAGFEPLVQGFVRVPLNDLDAVRQVAANNRNVSAVLIEPIQGEGGVRMTSPGFMRRLRLVTRIYDVPLLFDEVQTGWGATGRTWAHELFDLPIPPDAVIWAKKAQNGVLFVSEELATFFQEEKKFNTTWEGDSVGMMRLLAILDRLDLEQVRRTGARAREGLEALAADYSGLIRGVRGAGVMLGFDVVRADWRDALRDRAFRLGLILLPAGERTLRFYPRYDTAPYAIDEALAILRRALDGLVRGPAELLAAPGPEVRVGTFECPLVAVEVIELNPASFAEHQARIVAVEVDRYGDASRYPPDVLRAGGRPLLQFPPEMLAGTLSNPGAIGVALRDRVSGRIVAYALGSALEGHDEEGVSSDPRLGENNTFYLHAMATAPSVKNEIEIENHLLDLVHDRALTAGFLHLSTLIEERLHGTGPAWLRGAEVLQVVDNYLRSGLRFSYLSAPLTTTDAPDPAHESVDRRRSRS